MKLTLTQSIPGGETAEWTRPKYWAGERKEGKKKCFEGLRRFFVIVWPIKINGREEAVNLIGQIHFDRMTGIHFIYYDTIKLKNGDDYFILVERLCSQFFPLDLENHLFVDQNLL